jgi:SAM-dependent methyltransferase
MNLTYLIKNPKAYLLIAQKRIKNRIRTVLYKGKTVVCDICGWEGSTFFDGHCPKCNSLPRTRLIPFALKHFKLIDNTPKILHIAPNLNEYNYIRKHVTPLSNYDRLNIRPVSHINIVQDLTQTNLNGHQYDLSIAWHVLEHIPEDIKAIEEVYRLLKPGGCFLVSVPIYPIGNMETFEDFDIPYTDFEEVHGHYDHCRSCGLDYYQRFETVGFTTQELKVASLDEATIAYYGLRTDHVVWCFTK